MSGIITANVKGKSNDDFGKLSSVELFIVFDRKKLIIIILMFLELLCRSVNLNKNQGL